MLPSFNKACYYKTTNDFYLNYDIYFPKTVREFNENKGWVTLHTFFNFALIQQLFANKNIGMKTRLRNIFKTANAIMVVKFILENSYKFLQFQFLQ